MTFTVLINVHACLCKHCNLCVWVHPSPISCYIHIYTANYTIHHNTKVLLWTPPPAPILYIYQHSWNASCPIRMLGFDFERETCSVLKTVRTRLTCSTKVNRVQQGCRGWRTLHVLYRKAIPKVEFYWKCAELQRHITGKISHSESVQEKCEALSQLHKPC